MKVLLIDTFGTDGMLDFALRAQEDGHQVKWFFRRDDRNDSVGKGLVSRVADWREHMRWADLVVLSDNTKYLHELDRWRDQFGTSIIGASVKSSCWELDRKLGQETFRKAGIDVPAFREFTRYDDAMAYVKREGRAFVSKPSYDETDKALSYVGKTPADLIYMLGKWKRQNKLKGAFILQEKVSGCEMAVGAFVGPHGFNSGWCENWEFKKLCHGDMGCNVGEMGTVVRFTKRSKLAEKVLKPLEDQIVATGHTGYVDVNCIIDEHGDPWPLEFTMRPGWPTFNIQQSLNQGDTVEWLASLAEGRDAKPWRLDTISTGVVMALPGFPYGKTPIPDMVGVPIQGTSTSSRVSRLHPCCVMQGSAPADKDGKVVDEPCWMTAGDYVLVASGLGSSVRSSRARALTLLENLRVPASPFWRKDIGERLKTQLPEIQKHGFASNLLF